MVLNKLRNKIILSLNFFSLSQFSWSFHAKCYAVMLKNGVRTIYPRPFYPMTFYPMPFYPMPFYPTCQFTQCHFTQCHFTQCHFTQCHFTQCHFTQCHFTQCHYTQPASLPMLFYPLSILVYPIDNSTRTIFSRLYNKISARHQN